MDESGPFYKLVIDPVLKPIRKRLTNHIQKNESVIDIACGTGAQVFELAKKTSNIVGVDLSESMINTAKRRKQKNRFSNIEFYRADATDLAGFETNEFDVATMTLALHQFPPNLYFSILNEMKRVAKKIILVDYSVPLPKNIAGVGCQLAEFLAGREHNKNFSLYCKLNGLPGILDTNKLRVEKSETFGFGAFQLIVCSPSS